MHPHPFVPTPSRPSPRWWGVGFVLGLLVSLFACGLAHSAPPGRYTVTVIGPAAPNVANGHAGGFGSVSAEAIDDDGAIAGTVYLGQTSEAALLYPTVQLLGTLTPNTPSFGNNIKGGRVFGYGFGGQNNDFNHALQWTRHRGLQDLDGTAVLSVATRSLANGVWVGFAVPQGTLGAKPIIAYESTMWVLPTLGGPQGSAEALTPYHLIVGASQLASGVQHATFWWLGQPFDIHPPAALSSGAVDVNTWNWIILNTSYPGIGDQGFLWTPVFGFYGLPSLPGRSGNRVSALNQHGLVVGQVGDTIAIRWTPERGTEALTPLLTEPGWTLYNAVALNNRGQIVAYGTKDQRDQALLLTPMGASLAVAAAP